jgi:Ser/Thr protein kinase RdoA (MazF antagonist)
LTEERIQEIHKVKEYFNNGGIPIVQPIANRLGKSYFSFDGYFYALFPYINEKHLNRNDMPPKALESMASMLGKIHLLGKDPGFTIHDTFASWDREGFKNKVEAILEKIKLKKTKDSFDTLALESITLKKKLVEDHPRPLADYAIGQYHLIHGDYHDHNVFFNEKFEVTHVFDLEKTSMSPRTFELIRSIHFVCLDGPVDEKRLENARTYLKAYAKVYPLSQEEFREGLEVYFMKRIYSLWIEDEYYLKNNQRPTIFLKNNVETISYFKDHLKDLGDTLGNVLK